jgi:hypothetical protein
VSDYYQRRRWEAERDRENLRAQRMRALEEALHAVRTYEDDALSADERVALAEAARAVDSLRRVW